MSARANQIKIGAFVVGGLALLIGAIAVLGSGRLFRRTYPFVSYFDGSVNGLRPGAAVKFKGVEIGSVDQIRIPFRVDSNDQPIEVFFSLDSGLLSRGGEPRSDYGETLQKAIANGLRAQLESDSLLTGILHVSVAFTDEKEAVLHEPIEGVMEIPTIPPPLQEIGGAIRRIVDEIGQYDLQGLLASLHHTLDAVTDLARSPGIPATLAALEKTLASVDRTMVKLEARIDPLSQSVENAAASVGQVGQELGVGIASVTATMETVQRVSVDLGHGVVPLVESLKVSSDELQVLARELRSSLASAQVLLDPDAPIAVELQATLRYLGDAARSTRALFELLHRDPAALLRGKSSEGPETR